jgi:hypothetical protein
MLRRVGAAIALAGLMVLPATKTFAAPFNAPSAQLLTLQCTDGSTITVLTNSGHAGDNGQGQAKAFSPGFIVSGASGKALPLSITFTGTDVTNNNFVLFSGTQTKGQAQGPGGTIVQCSSTQTSTATAQDVAQAPGIISVGDTLQFTVDVTAVIKAH